MKSNRLKYTAFALLVIAAILTKVVLIDVVYIGKQYEKNKIITPWGEKIKSGNLSVDYTIEQAVDIKALGLNTVNVLI